MQEQASHFKLSRDAHEGCPAVIARYLLALIELRDWLGVRKELIPEDVLVAHADAIRRTKETFVAQINAESKTEGTGKDSDSPSRPGDGVPRERPKKRQKPEDLPRAKPINQEEERQPSLPPHLT